MAPTTTRCKHDSPLRCEWRASVAEHDPLRLHYSYEAGAWLLWMGDVPEVRDVCPGCQGKLPQMGPVVERLHTQGWPTIDGEDGG